MRMTPHGPGHRPAEYKVVGTCQTTRLDARESSASDQLLYQTLDRTAEAVMKTT